MLEDILLREERILWYTSGGVLPDPGVEQMDVNRPIYRGG